MFEEHLLRYLENVPSNAFEGDASEKAAEELISRTTPLSSKDTLKQRWEVAIRAEILSLAEQEQSRAKADPDAFYGRMFNILDLTMFLAEKECTEASLPFNLVRELFECLSIPSCSQVFSWVERRGKRLCLDPNKGKGPGLLVLRTLNELLRSLSKSTETEFCARILVFMNDIFPMSERSGVNLRGEYGPPWEGPPDPQEGKSVILAEATKEEERKTGVKDQGGDVKMGEGDDAEPTPEERKTLFYKTFWFMQYPFSKPAALSESDMFKAFQHAVNTVLPVLSEASKKERTLAGSKNLAGTKRRRESPERRDAKPSPTAAREQQPHRDYAFAKYLSSPELLELEIADTNFRRQFLFQLLILLQHLRNFTETEKAKWMEPRNRSLHMDFTLADTDENWVKEVNGKVILELRLTAPEGREFEETMRVILEREQNWIKWKNGLCQPFEKNPIPEEAEEEIRVKRRQLMTPPETWKWSYGTEALSEIWEMGYRDVYNLQSFRPIPDAPSFLSDIETVEKRMAARKAQIEGMLPRSEAPTAQDPSDTKPQLPPKPGTQQEDSKTGAQAAKPSVSSFAAEKEKRFQKDQLIQTLERQKQTYSWLALRSASKQYLHLFDKIGTGDVVKLVDQIKKSERGVQPEEEVNESLSDKADGEGTLGAGDVYVESQDVKMEVAEVSIKVESADMPVMEATEEVVKQEDSSLTELAEVPPTNAMEVDR